MRVVLVEWELIWIISDGLPVDGWGVSNFFHWAIHQAKIKDITDFIVFPAKPTQIRLEQRLWGSLHSQPRSPSLSVPDQGRPWSQKSVQLCPIPSRNRPVRGELWLIDRIWLKPRIRVRCSSCATRGHGLPSLVALATPCTYNASLFLWTRATIPGQDWTPMSYNRRQTYQSRSKP